MTERILDCEVAVVGGGPAGSMCAESLARQGIDVVLLERHSMPRNKVCAGGLTAAALRLLPVEVESILECLSHTVSVTALGRRTVALSAAAGLVGTVYREQLDWLLWQRAMAAGARTMDSSRVKAVERCTGRAVLRGEGFTLSARFLVGADGANGIVRRSCGFSRPEHVATGMMVEVPRPDAQVPDSETPVQLIGGLGGGTFGWIFPRSETLSIGVEWHRRRSDIEKALDRVVAHAGATMTENAVRWSHPIPSIPGDGRVVDGNVLLVGDAGGMCDPLTGEGVRNAVQSGTIAADVLAVACRSEESGLAHYQSWFEFELLPELKAGMTMLELALRFETPGLLTLQHQERARRACVGVLQGTTTYTAILRGAERFGGLLSLMLERRV